MTHQHDWGQELLYDEWRCACGAVVTAIEVARRPDREREWTDRDVFLAEILADRERRDL